MGADKTSDAGLIEKCMENAPCGRKTNRDDNGEVYHVLSYELILDNIIVYLSWKYRIRD